MIKKLEEGRGKIIGFEISGKLHDVDYKTFIPEVEEIIQKHGKAKILSYFRDFHGWDLHAFWDDLGFGLKHFGDIPKIAMVGDKKWEEWMTAICKPFTKAKVKYFDESEIDEAWVWLYNES